MDLWVIGKATDPLLQFWCSSLGASGAHFAHWQFICVLWDAKVVIWRKKVAFWTRPHTRSWMRFFQKNRDLWRSQNNFWRMRSALRNNPASLAPGMLVHSDVLWFWGKKWPGKRSEEGPEASRGGLKLVLDDLGVKHLMLQICYVDTFFLFIESGSWNDSVTLWGLK